ncbi:Crp/Fnr family transcriptional regulator [Sphaerotilus mobilis]|uniref:CRP-like cAMP-binding protein n=1 Tax=Sphaerotilus mobilis TaxID=47994 RepID=A0A4Q7LIX9_9BURK|nr:Crp/Fnr family transcriptional regulator [Sphaerotilus mobilis]RZS53389.1 CRP-like cAMP-binding protein [Sphaerotilus mobilis]
MTLLRSTDARALSGLRQVHLLRDLPDEIVSEVGQICQFKLFRSRQIVMSRDERDRDCYLILSGKVRVVALSPSGKEVSFRDAGPGELIGEMSAIDRLPRSATVVAVQDALLARMSPDDLLALLRRHWDVNERMLRHLAGAARGLTERVYELSALNVSQRLCAELLRLSHASAASPKAQRCLLDPTPSHSELAGRISCTREQVTRELGDLRRARVIECSTRGRVVVDLLRLADRVDVPTSSPTAPCEATKRSVAPRTSVESM